MTQPRSSLAIALQDYKGPRPGIALTIAAIALIAALIVGLVHTVGLGRSGAAIAEGGRTMRTLHRYNAALEVWGQMAATQPQFAQQRELRDSLGAALKTQLGELQAQLVDSTDKELVGEVIGDINSWTPDRPVEAGPVGQRGREAMMVLTARQDSALFRTAAGYQRSQMFAAILIGLTVIAAGVLIIPMSWVYVRYKRGIPPGM
jgi:carboxylesterase type B